MLQLSTGSVGPWRPDPCKSSTHPAEARHIYQRISAQLAARWWKCAGKWKSIWIKIPAWLLRAFNTELWHRRSHKPRGERRGSELKMLSAAFNAFHIQMSPRQSSRFSTLIYTIGTCDTDAAFTDSLLLLDISRRFMLTGCTKRACSCCEVTTSQTKNQWSKMHSVRRDKTSRCILCICVRDFRFMPRSKNGLCTLVSLNGVSCRLKHGGEASS